MKNIIGWTLVAAFALAGCDKPDAQKEVAQMVSHAYENKAGKGKSLGNAEAGKAVAGKCARCHGIDGVLASLGAPFIAGLHQDYMVSAMLAYADGSRRNDQMRDIAVELKLKPEQIADVSAYYASLKTSWKGADVGNKSSYTPMVSLSQDTVNTGAAIASRCNSCHGASRSTSKNELIPVLAAMPPEYFIPSLKSYFNGKRRHDVMKIFSSLKDSEIRQLAAYYAVQPPLNRPRPGKGNARAGEMAAGACAGCHSIDGNALNPEIPSLAGQPAEYLIKAIMDYRGGRRNDPLMSDAVRRMQDETIVNLAAYYAVQKPESPLHPPGQGNGQFAPVAEGRRIAGSCDGCHGRNGNSNKVGIPSLTGLHVKYLVSATRDYRDGVRKNGVMKKVVGHLSDSDIEKVGFYYATQSPMPGKPAPKADLAAGEKISSGCTSCHGHGGISTAPATPSLAGQDANYLAAATRDYASGARSNEAMAGPAKGLKPDETINVAGYFASLKAAKPDITLPLSPQFSIVQKCNRCHGENGRSTEPGTPSLAGQSEAYLVLALKEYQDGTRKNKFMNAMSDVLSLVEMKAISAFYARQ
ncbi:MAG: c-type cytochrome [Nitrosomonadales bacterium]|nr:c-type cytochrome [Nitrosomonadales bacterium]